MKEKSQQEMNLTRERILQAQRTATQTTLTKIPYYKFSCVLKLLESLVKRYPYIKHTHQIWGYVLFTFLPQYIRMLPFMTNWSALDRIFLIFAKLMFWFSFLSLLAILCQFSFLFFFFLPIIDSQLESLSTFLLRWLLPNPTLCHRAKQESTTYAVQLSSG